MNSLVSYPEHMQREARALVAATRANPGKEAAMAIYEFIERSPEHDSCFKSEVEQQRLQRQPFRITRNTQSLIGRHLIGLAAGIAILFWAYWLLTNSAEPPIERTGLYARVYELADGSRVLLFPNSSMRRPESADLRRIELLSGGLAAKPKHDASRPFELVAGNTRVAALGTQFTVLRGPEGTEVGLIDGKLTVSATNGGSVDLAPGEFTRINTVGVISTPAAKLTARSQAPAEPRTGTIAKIASDFNSQNSRMQIEVNDKLHKRYDFTLQLDNPEEWLKELARTSSFRVERRSDLITIVKITVVR